MLCTPELARPISTSPGFRFSPVIRSLLVYHTYRKTCQVILVLRHQSGVLCRLAADQSRACLTAAFRYALYDIRDLLRFILAAGNIVQEEQTARRRHRPHRSRT